MVVESDTLTSLVNELIELGETLANCTVAVDSKWCDEVDVERVGE